MRRSPIFQTGSLSRMPEGRADMRLTLIRGKPIFSTYGVAMVITRPCVDGSQVVHHIEAFYGNDGREVRGQAVRRFKAIRAGASHGLRDTRLPSTFSARGLLFERDAVTESI